MPTPTLRVFDSTLTAIAVLDQPYNIGWVDSLLDVGAGEFKVRHDSPVVQANPSLLDKGNVVRVELDETPAFAWEVERRHRRRGETWDEVSVTGPGALNLLNHALVYAPLEQESLGSRQRVFGWQAIDYDDSGWDSPAPYSGGTQESPVRSSRSGHPEGWPDDKAEWIWGADVDGSGNHPVGNVYFRRSIDVDAVGLTPGLARLHVTADNNFVCYFDGEQVATGSDWRGFATVDVEFVAGATHVIAVEARTRSGAGGLLMTIMELLDDPDDDEELGGVWFRTFTPDVFGGAGTPGPWRTLAYPAEVPGVTHGFVLQTLFDEAKARGSLTPLTIDFDATVDSAGTAWADEVEVTCQVGNDTVLTVMDRLRDWPVEFRLDPATWTFQAFVTAGADRGGTPDTGMSTVTIPTNRAGELAWESEDDTYDVLLVQSEFAWGEVPDSPPASNRREGFLSLAQSPTLSLALKQAERIRQRWSTPREQVTFVTGATGVPVPYDDYFVGDIVEGPSLPSPTGSWALDDLRIDTVAARITQAGELDWVHESVVVRLVSSMERLLTSREALGDGTLAGRTKVSTAPLGGGLGVATAGRRGGGEGGGIPSTITLLASGDYGPGIASVEFEFALLETSRRNLFPLDVPATDIELPYSGTWEFTIIYRHDQVDRDFPGGGVINVLLDGLLVWPLAGESTSATPPEDMAMPEFTGSVTLNAFRGQKVQIRVGHPGDEPQPGQVRVEAALRETDEAGGTRVFTFPPEYSDLFLYGEIRVSTDEYPSSDAADYAGGPMDCSPDGTRVVVWNGVEDWDIYPVRGGVGEGRPALVGDWSGEGTRVVRWSPDGRWIVFNRYVSTGPETNERIYRWVVFDVAANEFVFEPQVRSEIIAPPNCGAAFSPRGDWLALTFGRFLRMVNVNTWEIDGSWPSTDIGTKVAFSPAGDRLFCLAQDQQTVSGVINVVNMDDKAVESGWEDTAHSNFAGGVGWSADGRWVGAASSFSTAGYVTIWDAETRLIDSGYAGAAGSFRDDGHFDTSEWPSNATGKRIAWSRGNFMVLGSIASGGSGTKRSYLFDVGSGNRVGDPTNHGEIEFFSLVFPGPASIHGG